MEAWTATWLPGRFSFDGANEVITAEWKFGVNGHDSSEFQAPTYGLSSQDETPCTIAIRLPRTPTNIARYTVGEGLRSKSLSEPDSLQTTWIEKKSLQTV